MRRRDFVNQKSKGLNVKVTPEEHELVRLEAERQSINMSELICNIVFPALQAIKRKK